MYIYICLVLSRIGDVTLCCCPQSGRLEGTVPWPPGQLDGNRALLGNGPRAVLHAQGEMDGGKS